MTEITDQQVICKETDYGNYFRLQTNVSYFCKLVLLLIHEPKYCDPAYILFSASSHISVGDLSFPLLLFGLDTSLLPQTAQTGFISSSSTMTHMLLVFTCTCGGKGVHIILIICCYHVIRLLCL